jgi:hypothetical protein
MSKRPKNLPKKLFRFFYERNYTRTAELWRRDLFAPGLMKPVRAEVAFSSVGKNGEEALSGSEFASGNAACMKNRASRNAAEDTFLCREAVSGGSGFFVGNCHYTIDHVSV